MVASSPSSSPSSRLATVLLLAAIPFLLFFTGCSGSECQSDADCADDQVCYTEAATCNDVCDDEADCPDGFDCVDGMCEYIGMEGGLLTDVMLPVSLIIIMIGLGMSLTVMDFKRILVYPRAVAIGLTNQIILLPLIGFGLAIAFGLSPIWAVGLMLIAACPGGPTSNLITFVSRGDTALSITLTAFSSLITVLTIPLILTLSISYFEISADTIEAPVVDIIVQIVAVTAVPVTIGLLIRHFKPDFADKMDKPARIASALIFLLVLAAIIISEWQLIVDNFVNLSAVTVALNLATMAVGFFTARLIALDMRQSITVSIESGIQNGTLAIVIATSILGAGSVAIPPGIYSLLMFVSGGALMYFFGVVTAPGEFDEDVEDEADDEALAPPPEADGELDSDEDETEE